MPHDHYVTLGLRADTAKLVVRDTGPGIPEAARAVPTDHDGGFGLGLYLSRRIAEAYGGAISVENTSSHGNDDRGRATDPVLALNHLLP